MARMTGLGWALPLALAASVGVRPSLARADDSVSRDAGQGASTAIHPLEEAPRIVYAHQAFGATAWTLGASASGIGNGGFQRTGTAPEFGGGVHVWGSPVDRLTLMVDVDRRIDAVRVAPEIGAQVRILGNRAAGWALGGLARYKAEGFAEISGELEIGALFTLSRRRVHLDVNGIVGAGFEEGEADGEALVRAGYDVLDFLRLGGEGRFRDRLSGDAELPGGRKWDGFLAAQVMGTWSHFFLAVGAGPATAAATRDVGWLASATAGGVVF